MDIKLPIGTKVKLCKSMCQQMNMKSLYGVIIANDDVLIPYDYTVKWEDDSERDMYKSEITRK